MASFMTGRAKLMVAVAAAGVAVGAFFFLRDDDEAKGGRAQVEEGSAQPERDLPVAGDVRRPVRDVPARDVGPADPSAPEVHELADGSRVVDHRKSKTPYIRPGVPHPSLSPVDGNVTTAVMRELRPIILDCLKDVPTEAMSDEAVVMAYAVIAIDGAGNVTASEIGADASGIDSPGLPDAMQCVANAASQVSVQVEHEAVESAKVSARVLPRRFR